MDLYIGVDLGTSGCRAYAIDDAGEIHGSSAVALPRPVRRHPNSEQKPEVWWHAVLGAVEALLTQIPPRDVVSISVDGTSSTLLLTDVDGQPLGPALMYNDSRGRAEADRIAAVAPDDSPARGAGSSLAKLLFLYARANEAHHALHQADWISNCLCGKFGISDENNCLKLGYDVVQGRWPEWINKLNFPTTLLPQVVSPGTVIGTIKPDLCKRLGMTRTTQVVAGTTDSTAAFLATGASQPGQAVTSLGSTLVLKIVSPRPIFAAEYGVYSHRIGALWLAGGASNSGGAVLLQYFSQNELEAMTPRLDPDQETGLDYYPLLEPGERFPINDPDLNPRLRPRPDDPLEFFQGILEGIARIERRGYELLAQLGAPYPNSVRTVGGGAKNAGWNAIRHRMLGVTVSQPAHNEAAFGAALLARKGARHASTSSDQEFP